MTVWTYDEMTEWFGDDFEARDETMRHEREEAKMKRTCENCGDGSFDGDEVVEYEQGWSHIECAIAAGWED